MPFLALFPPCLYQTSKFDASWARTLGERCWLHARTNAGLYSLERQYQSRVTFRPICISHGFEEALCKLGLGGIRNPALAREHARLPCNRDERSLASSLVCISPRLVDFYEITVFMEPSINKVEVLVSLLTIRMGLSWYAKTELACPCIFPQQIESSGLLLPGDANNTGHSALKTGGYNLFAHDCSGEAV